MTPNPPDQVAPRLPPTSVAVLRYLVRLIAFAEWENVGGLVCRRLPSRELAEHPLINRAASLPSIPCSELDAATDCCMLDKLAARIGIALAPANRIALLAHGCA